MSVNPWMRSQTKDEVVEPEVAGPLLVVPTWSSRSGGGFDHLLLVSAHAGAGSTAVSSVTGISECGMDWDSVSASSGVIVVARGDMRGLTALSDAARAWSEGAIKGVLVGAVVNADHPKELKELKTFREFVCRGFPQSWFIPFVDSWRLQPGSREGLPKGAMRVFNDLAMLNTSRKEKQ